MKRIKGFVDFKAFAEGSDLGKINLFSHSDKFSFSHVDHAVKAVGAHLFNYVASPGIFPESIDPELPVYNYGNSDEIVDVIKSGAMKRKNIYNQPQNLKFANNKIEFHKAMEGQKFVPKTVFTKDEALKLRFPVIAKPKGGSKGQGIVVFKTKDDLLNHKPADGDEPLDLYSEKFDLQKEFRVICLKGKPLYIAERIPVNQKAKALRESRDIFMEQGTHDKRSGYKWKERKFGNGIPEESDFEKICKKTCDLLKLEILGVDIGVDSNGKLWLIEANTCPGLNNDQIVKIYLAIFRDFYGRDPEPYSMEKIKFLQKELKTRNKDATKFSFHNIMGRRMDYGIDDVASASVKFDLEKSFGDTLSNIKSKKKF